MIVVSDTIMDTIASSADLAALPTPYYAYDLDVAEQRVSELFDVFPSNSELFFSFKANPLPGLASAIGAAGARADLTSPGEIDAAVAAGFDLGLALYGGPGKNRDEFVHALSMGIRSFSIESFHDLGALNAAVANVDGDVQVLLRVNPMEPPRAKLVMSGVASQFGFEEEDLLAHGPLERSPGVNIVGFHIYWGTQVGGPDELAACFSNAVTTAEALATSLDIPLDILNLGGGFPWPYAVDGSGPDLSPLREPLAALRSGDGAASSATWWFESGRHCTASCGHLVTRVMDRKVSKDKEFVILDSGINHLGGMTGLGRIPRFAIRMIPPNNRSADTLVADVVGQLCTPLDLVGRKVEIPTDLAIGDVVAIPNVGAYGASGSLTNFLSRPAVLEACHRSGKITSIEQLATGHRTVDHLTQ